MMTSTATIAVRTIAEGGISLLLVAMLVCLLRLVRGPTKVDRILSLDVVSVLAVGVLGLMSLIQRDAYFVDVATVVVLVTFLATIGYARFVITTGSRGSSHDG